MSELIQKLMDKTSTLLGIIFILLTPFVIFSVFLWSVHNVKLVDWTVSGNVVLKDGIGVITIYHPTKMEANIFKKQYKAGDILTVRLF